MGEVRVKLELENAVDRQNVSRGYQKEAEVRVATVEAVADSGAVMLFLPQELVERLGLIEYGKAVVTYADERKEERPIAGIVTVRIGDRVANVNCIVGPPTSETLLGQEILETMDLLVDCGRRRLIPRPESPFLPLIKAK